MILFLNIFFNYNNMLIFVYLLFITFIRIIIKRNIYTVCPLE
jgi:hypothetical protein